MKKVLNKIMEEISTILLLPIFFIMLIVLILQLPIDYIKYKKSRYYKDTREKYEIFEGRSYFFDFYEFVKENNLPIEFIRNKDDEFGEFGYFFYDKTLVIIDAWACYDQKKGVWGIDIGDEERDVYTFEEYVNLLINEFNKHEESNVCDKAMILLDEGEYEEYLNELKDNDTVILYNKDNLKEKLIESLNISI